MFTNRMRYIAKHSVNRLTIRSAGKVHSQFAAICHVGRRSGKTYETPLMVFPRGDDFIIVLTYGPEVDWYRNLRAAGQGILRWQGKTYTIGRPEPVDSALTWPVIPPFQRFILRLLHNQYFVSVNSVANV